MSRKTKTRSAVLDDDRFVEPEVEGPDPHGFWDVDRLDAEDNDDAFALVIEEHEDETPAERATAVYMGRVAEVDPVECGLLADWAESKACRACRRRFHRDGDLARLQHDECRTAFRVGELLHRDR
jgi:hypothetical protein